MEMRARAEVKILRVRRHYPGAGRLPLPVLLAL